MDKQYLNPAGIYKHPAFTRVISVNEPSKFIFIAGQTPSDENYKCVGPGDLRAQYVKVMENLDIQLSAAGARWDDVVYKRIFVLDVDAFLAIASDPDTPRFGDQEKLPPATMIGVTRLSNPDFLIEIDLMAITGN